MDTLVILVAVATVAVPVLAEVAAAYPFAAPEPTRRRDALRCS
jgi:hypothetical protein